MRCLATLDVGVRFELEQIFRCVDVEFGARHGKPDEPIDVPVQQELRAVVATNEANCGCMLSRKMNVRCSISAMSAKLVAAPLRGEAH